MSELGEKKSIAQSKTVEPLLTARSQYVPDKSLRRVCLEKAEKIEECNK